MAKNKKKNILDKFSTHLKKAFILSFNIVKESPHNRKKITTTDIVQALYYQEGGIAYEIMRKANVKPDIFKESIANSKTDVKESSNLGRLFKFIQKDSKEQNEITFSKTAKKAILTAVVLAKRHNHAFVGTEHLLLSILGEQKAEINHIFEKNNIDTLFIEEQITNILESTAKFADMANMFSTSQGKDEKPESTLSHFCEELTSEEKQKTIDSITGRDKEIERIVHILGRRNKNNVLLVGEPGVGKTAIINGLAKKIAEGKVPPILRSKKIFELDPAKIIAGTMFRGEFESRLKSLIDSAKNDPSTILFVDEIHSLVGLGNAQGSLDATNILKPALTTGDFQVIGTTTFSEFKKHIENDPAFERRFQVITINEPSIEEAVQIITETINNYEEFHNIAIDKEAIKAAVKLSDRYIPDKRLPDKAIDILDEAASKTNIAKTDVKLFAAIEKAKKEREEIKAKKHEAVFEEAFEKALTLQAQERQIEKKIKQLKRKEKRDKKDWPQITEEDVGKIIAEITNIPQNKILKEEKEKLLKLEQILKKSIVGQNEAIETIAKFTRRARSGLNHPERPVGSFMFLGPTGTGKTELAKVIAEEIFDDADALIRIDMSEYGEKFNASKLIGAPAGYVGYEEGGKLEEVRRKPYSVVLFDEIEKAHPDIFNLLLQILDEGFITDASGRKINFRNTIIIMTSNTGTKSILEAEAGFKGTHEEATLNYDEYQQKLLKELKQEFKPEFLNRIDRVIIFKPLDSSAIKKITQLHIKELADRLLKEKNISLDIDKAVEEIIAKEGFDPERGARPLRKAIQELIEDELAEQIIKEVINDGDTAKVVKKNKKIEVVKG